MRCDACADHGWLHAFNTDKDKDEIQRCDSCAVIVDDAAASRIHDAGCGCDWEKRFAPKEASSNKRAPKPSMTPFSVGSIAKQIAKTVGAAIDHELSNSHGWIAPRIHTVVCDGIAHEYRRILATLSGCRSCFDKVKSLEKEAHQQRFIG